MVSRAAITRASQPRSPAAAQRQAVSRAPPTSARPQRPGADARRPYTHRCRRPSAGRFICSRRLASRFACGRAHTFPAPSQASYWLAAYSAWSHARRKKRQRSSTATSRPPRTPYSLSDPPTSEYSVSKPAAGVRSPLTMDRASAVGSTSPPSRRGSNGCAPPT